MSRHIYVNLPIRDIGRSQAFFQALGFTINPRFTNEQAACVEITPGIYVMLLIEPFFQGFTRLPISDARQATEVLLALSCDSRQEVDQLVAKAVAAGGTATNAARDFGSMYQHGFADPDGHQWELVFMDESAAPQQL